MRTWSTSQGFAAAMGIILRVWFKLAFRQFANETVKKPLEKSGVYVILKSVGHLCET
jgi:hypothetical protein